MSAVRFLVAVTVLAVGLASFSSAEENKKNRNDKKNPESKEKAKNADANNNVIHSKLSKNNTKNGNAGTIDFPKAYGLPFDSLVMLGARIQGARLSADPVSLANLSKELAVDEQVSGKKASLTSEELWQEASRLAELRHHSAELKALSLMAPDEKAKEDLAARAQKAQNDEQQMANAVKAGEKPRGIGGERGGRLTIINKTGDVLFIFIDGQRVGTLNAFGTSSYTVYDPLGSNTYLEAYSTDHDAYVKTVGKPEVEYTWIIDEG